MSQAVFGGRRFPDSVDEVGAGVRRSPPGEQSAQAIARRQLVDHQPLNPLDIDLPVPADQLPDIDVVGFRASLAAREVEDVEEVDAHVRRDQRFLLHIQRDHRPVDPQPDPVDPPPAEHFRLFRVASTSGALVEVDLTRKEQKALDVPYQALKRKLLIGRPPGAEVEIDFTNSRAVVTVNGQRHEVSLNSEEHAELEDIRQLLAEFKIMGDATPKQRYHKDSIGSLSGASQLKREGAVLTAQVNNLQEYRQQHLAKNLDGKKADDQRGILTCFTMAELTLDVYRNVIQDQITAHEQTRNNTPDPAVKQYEQQIVDELKQVLIKLNTEIDGFALGFALTHPNKERDPAKRFDSTALEQELEGPLKSQIVQLSRGWKAWRSFKHVFMPPVKKMPEEEEADQISKYIHDVAHLALVSSREDNERFAEAHKKPIAAETPELVLKATAEAFVNGPAPVIVRSGTLLNKLPRDVKGVIEGKMILAFVEMQQFKNDLLAVPAVAGLADGTAGAACVAAYTAAEEDLRKKNPLFKKAPR
jgi:hypothetical protein